MKREQNKTSPTQNESVFKIASKTHEEPNANINMKKNQESEHCIPVEINLLIIQTLNML